MAFHSKRGPKVILRDVEPSLRRARLLAARQYPIGSVVRRGIISGQWDGGHVVQRHLIPGFLLQKSDEENG